MKRGKQKGRDTCGRCISYDSGFCGWWGAGVKDWEECEKFVPRDFHEKEQTNK